MNRPAVPTAMPLPPKPAPHRTVDNEPTNQDLELQLGIALTKIHRLEQQVQDLQDKATGIPNLYRDGDTYYIKVKATGQEDKLDEMINLLGQLVQQGQEDKDLVTFYANDKPYQVNMHTGLVVRDKPYQAGTVVGHSTGQFDRGKPTKPHKD